jgi:prolyl 4-hydroxylase
MFALAGSGDAQASAWLEAARAAHHPLAPSTPPNYVAIPEGAAEPDWDQLSSQADLSWFDRPIRRQLEHSSPQIETLPDLLPVSVCEYVIGMAAPHLQRGRIVERDGVERVNPQRSNAVMNFGLAASDFVLELVNRRAASAAGMPAENAEGLGVLHYRPGESYAPHVDYCDENAANAAQLAAKGQRVRTLLVYLNDEFAGGETEFPRLGKQFRLPRGGALLFHSVDTAGRVDPLTVHAGRTPTRGDKWIISKWFRTRALRPAAPAV